MIKRMELWFGISVVIIVLSLALLIFVRPTWGIDFVGGTLLEVKDPNAASDSVKVTDLLKKQFNLSASAIATQDQSLIIRTETLNDTQHKAVLKALTDAHITSEELQFESIGPTIGQELRSKAWKAAGLAVIGMILYLAYSFRRSVGIIKPWKFGVAATYALLHDLLFVSAVFVILGKVWGVTVDTLFVTAMLSVMGYSVNDTIVIFDRLREEWLRSRNVPLRDILDRATMLSVNRSINISITILLVLISMLVLGGSSIRWFMVALIAGTAVGTYSSIFVATPCLYFLTTRTKRK
jgi:preprotein translocase subunit SecF